MNNIGWLYYRDYFDNDTLRDAHDINNCTLLKKQKEEKLNGIFRLKNQKIFNQILPNNPGNYIHNNKRLFNLKIENNGLVTGVGMGHETGYMGELKLGFTFDYTTGLPIIQGFSVKGTLRSVFPNRLRLQAKNERDVTLKAKLLRKAVQKEKYCNAVFQQNEIILSKDQLFVFEWMVFEGSIPTKYIWNKEGIPIISEEKPISIYESDVFHDAFISDSDRTPKKFLGNDFITPHKNFKTQDKAYDALVDPTPLQFMKILPDVIFSFQFDLKESIIDKNLSISIETKLEIFKEILLDQGIGAKTNVGYGQFKEATTPA